MTRIECHQLAPRVGELAANQHLALAAIRSSASAGVDVIVLPELVTSGYVFSSAAEAAQLAVGRDDPMFTSWAEAAGDSLVIAGFAERAGDGLLYNSAVALDGTGIRAVYRKIHLWDSEKLVFTPGGDAPPILDTRHGRIGILICYDLEFPELTRAVALAGADLIAAPTNWPLTERPAGERAAEVLNCMVTARVNHLAIACCDRTGTERGQRWTAGTTIIDQDGWPVATADDAGVAGAELDLLRSRDKTLTPLCDAFGDRRPELYARIFPLQH